ncbi:MAG TPA: S8 family serine peptidase [Gemmataceae bacterium]|nr:S8 family serine peptidase [Gemmataceae bacterium]
MTRRAQRPAMTSRNRRQDSRVSLRLEALEDRTLLSAAPALVPGTYDPSQLLVQFQPAAVANGDPVLNVLPGATLGPQLPSVAGLYDVELNGLSVNAALAIFQADPLVASVTPDYYVQVTGNPNDPQFTNQWGVLNTGQAGGTAGVDVKAAQAWSTTTGSPGVTVAMIDTGIDYNNPDLYDNIWINQAEIPNSWYTKSSAASTTYNVVVNKSQIKTATPGVITMADLNNPVNNGLVWPSDGKSYIDPSDLLRPLAQGGWESGSTKDGDTAHPDDFFGWNFVANNNNPFDDNGHGTNVAGILAAQGNNAYGVAGVDWTVPLMPLKAFDSSGQATLSALVQAIDYSVQHGAKISNDSWTESVNTLDLQDAIAAAQNAGQIFVAAAGNNGSSIPSYPALYTTQFDNVVSVAAVTRTGQLWSNSNYGASTVTLAAPGVDIVGDAVGGGVDTYTGTSQAVPFVTGTLALVWGEHPTWTYKQVIAQVTSTATPLPSLKGKTITGGMVNTAAAVGSSNGGSNSPQPHVTSAVFSGPNANSLSKAVLTFDQVMNLSTFTSSQVHLTNPSGQSISVTPKLAAGSNGSQIEIDFATQTIPGVYKLSLGNGILDSAGVALAPYTVSDTLTQSSYTFSSSGPTTIPSLRTVISTITVNQDITIGSLAATLNITFPNDSGLFIFLQAPDGTQVLLVAHRGGTGQNFVGTILSAGASKAIGAGAAPFTGTFLPESTLSVLNGGDARGVWTLWVENDAFGAAGVLNSWSLTITAGSAGTSGTVSGDLVRALTTTTPGGPPTPAAMGSSAKPTVAADAVFAAGAQHLPAIGGIDAWLLLGGSSASNDDDWTKELS